MSTVVASLLYFLLMWHERENFMTFLNRDEFLRVFEESLELISEDDYNKFNFVRILKDSDKFEESLEVAYDDVVFDLTDEKMEDVEHGYNPV